MRPIAACPQVLMCLCLLNYVCSQALHVSDLPKDGVLRVAHLQRRESASQIELLKQESRLLQAKNCTLKQYEKQTE